MCDLLNLAQRVLERLHIPQADILQRKLIVGRIGCINGRLGGKLAQQEAIKAIGLLRPSRCYAQCRAARESIRWV